MTTQELLIRWIMILRQKAEYEHEDRKAGKSICSPDIDDICNEMEAFSTGITNNQN